MSVCKEKFNNEGIISSTCSSSVLKITLKGARYDNPIPPTVEESCTNSNACNNNGDYKYCVNGSADSCGNVSYVCRLICGDRQDCISGCTDAYNGCVDRCKIAYCGPYVPDDANACTSGSPYYNITIMLGGTGIAVFKILRTSDTSATLEYSSIIKGLSYILNNNILDDNNVPMVTIIINNKDLLPNTIKPYVANGDSYVIRFYVKDTDKWYTEVGYNYTPIPPKLSSKRLVFRSARPPSENDSECPDNSLRVPDIVITGQTTLDGSDISDVYFTIRDLIDNNSNSCEIRCAKDNEIKTKEYVRYCPFIVCVLKGVGDSARDKLKSLKPNLDDEEFDEFYTKVITYAMLKYILIKLLSGCWNINYITNKYNKRFMCELSSSRYCEFARFFTDPGSPIYGYEVYFK